MALSKFNGWIALYLCMLWPGLLLSQNAPLDSLRRVAWDTSLPDTSRMRTLLQLGERVYLLSQPDTAYHYALASLELALRQGLQGAQADALRIAAIALHIKGDNKESIALHEQVIAIRQALNDQLGLAKAYGNIALSYKAQGDYNQAIDYCMKALKINEKIGNEAGTAAVLHNLGQFCFDQAYNATQSSVRESNFAKAESYYAQSVAIKNKLGDTHGAVRSRSGLLMVLRSQEKYREALDLALELMEYAKDAGPVYHSAAHNNLAVVYQDLAYIETDQALQKEYYNKALYHFTRGLELRRAMGNLSDIANSLNNLGILQAELGNHVEAIKLNSEALELARSFNNREQVRNIAESLFKSYEQLKEYPEALSMYKLYVAMRDSINSDESREQLLKQELEWAFEKQQLEEAARYESALQQQKNLRNLSFAGGGILFLVAFIFFNRFKLKQRAARALELKNAEVEAARERAERSEAFRSQFLANMSHEIRTPMNAIIGLTRLLKDRPLEPESRTYVDAVDHASHNLLVVINDILDLSKLEAGKMEPRLAPAHLHRELEQIATAFTERAAAKGIAFTLHMAPNVPQVVIADMPRVSQILYNLLGNAIKFTSQGAVTLTVRRLEDAGGSRLSFAVSDTGIGIPPDRLEQIFESFGQVHTHDGRSYGGTGLGLTIARSLARILGGDIDVESIPGKGSVFTLHIPCSEGTEVQWREVQEAQRILLNEAHRCYPLRILLADDNEYNLLVAKDTLAKYLLAATVTTAQSGREVLQLLSQHAYDILLLDVQMPGMDGYACARAIRELHGDVAGIPIIAFTASVIRADIQRCFDAGMNGYVPKPFLDEDLLRPIVARIDALLQGPGEPHLAKAAPAEAATTAATTDDGRAALFLKLVPTRLAKLQEALRNGDLNTAKRTAHLLKPQLLDFGLHHLSESLDWFEHAGLTLPESEWVPRGEALAEAIAVALRDAARS